MMSLLAKISENYEYIREKSNTMESIIDKIQISFTEEAKNSPVLLSDLANMEFYIAESYQNRSVIELLQNADDAFSTQAYLKVFDNTVIFANNGNYFTDADVESICRSGASGKKRGNNTIGYRGIGFKSVVNICKKVHMKLRNKGIQGGSRRSFLLKTNLKR